MTSPFTSLPKRVGVAVIAIPVILWFAFLGGYYFFLLVATISSVSLFEFYTLEEKKGIRPAKAIGLVFGFLVNTSFVYDRAYVSILRVFESIGSHPAMFSLPQYFLFVLLVFLLTVALFELFRREGSALLNASATITGVLLISTFFGTLIWTRELFPYGFPVSKFFPNALATDAQFAQIERWGGFTVATLFATIWMCDTAAYFGGLTLGRHKLFESVSPKKTWEGAVFGYVFSVLTMLLAQRMFLDYMSSLDAVVLGSIVGIFGQLGDLVESKFKRDAGVKDSSSLIPGHGGVYDRFDSLVFVAPIVYLYVDFVILS